MRAAAPLVVLWLAAASLAQAHARPAVFNAIRVDRSDPRHVVAQATWGFAVTRDGGRSWRWACAAVLGVDPRFEDPRILLGYEGRVLASTFDGVFASDPAGCEWSFASEALTDRWVIDLAADPSDPTRMYAVTTDVAASDQLYRSTDEGRSWEAWGPPQGDVLLDTLLVAPSRPERIYVSADIPGLPEERRTMVLRSDDGGASFERLELTGLTGVERYLRIRAVSPVDPDVLYAVVLAADGGVLDPHRLVRSEDGGATFATVLEASQLGDVVISEDGATVWTASRAGGVFRSDDGGLGFSRVQADLPVSCLTWTDGELRACTVQQVAGFALARSADRGATWEPLLRLEEIDEMVECPRCSDVGIACPPWLPDVSYDLGFDAGIEIDLEPDGGVGLPRDAGLPVEGGGGRAGDRGGDPARAPGTPAGPREGHGAARPGLVDVASRGDAEPRGHRCCRADRSVPGRTRDAHHSCQRGPFRGEIRSWPCNPDRSLANGSAWGLRSAQAGWASWSELAPTGDAIDRAIHLLETARRRRSFASSRVPGSSTGCSARRSSSSGLRAPGPARSKPRIPSSTP